MFVTRSHQNLFSFFERGRCIYYALMFKDLQNVIFVFPNFPVQNKLDTNINFFLELICIHLHIYIFCIVEG